MHPGFARAEFVPGAEDSALSRVPEKLWMLFLRLLFGWWCMFSTHGSGDVSFKIIPNPTHSLLGSLQEHHVAAVIPA